MTSASSPLASVLDRLRALLGDDAVETDGDPVMMLDDALARLVEHSATEGNTAAALALEMADLRMEFAREATERRLQSIYAVQRALARLRTVTSTKEMVARSTALLCDMCGFEKAMMYRIEDGRIYPDSAYAPRDPGLLERAQELERTNGPFRLEDMLFEADMFRRRSAAIVHDAMNDPRLKPDYVKVAGVKAFVGAPILPEGRVIGFLLASRSPDVDVFDRDVLWAFAEGYGYALERTILIERLHREGARINDLVASTAAALIEIREAELMITGTTERIATEEHTPAVRSALLWAPTSRIHDILTRRELEIMELLAHGETNKQIADRMIVSEGTVKSHVSQILRKLSSSNRAEAVSKFMRMTETATT
jgi:LuxR family transcriptional regulator, regulator of acetate metabolism